MTPESNVDANYHDEVVKVWMRMYDEQAAELKRTEGDLTVAVAEAQHARGRWDDLSGRVADLAKRRSNAIKACRTAPRKAPSADYMRLANAVLMALGADE